MTAKSDEGETKYVYTCSSKADMVELLEQSISSLKQYVDAGDIIVFFTPPIDEADVERIRDLGAEVRKRPHFSEPVQLNGFNPPTHYSDKAYFTEVDSENVVFLDCDTLVLQDITEIVEGQFRFKARKAREITDEWSNFLESYEVDNVFPEVNAGFLVFKNSFHKEIKEDFRKFLRKDLHIQDLGDNTHDQLALALAVANQFSENSSDFEAMSSLEHRCAWRDEEFNSSVYVFHREDNKKLDLLGNISASLNSRVPIDIERICKKVRGVVS